MYLKFFSFLSMTILYFKTCAVIFLSVCKEVDNTSGFDETP